VTVRDGNAGPSRGRGEGVAVVWVRNADERVPTLPERQPTQVDGAVLGDDPAEIAARDHHRSAEPGHDARAGSRDRAQRDDRDATGRQRRAAGEVKRTADRADTSNSLRSSSLRVLPPPP
jgi:hypothetical protein